MSDRGMKKWAPYKSLVEQEKYLKNVENCNKTLQKPLISSEKAEEINQILVNYLDEILFITFYRNRKLYEVTSPIKKIDCINKKLILPDNQSICLKEIINLEII